MGLSLVASNTSTIDEANYNRWFNFCLICNHGSHAGHAKEWFSKHTLCPVPECECKSYTSRLAADDSLFANPNAC